MLRIFVAFIIVGFLFIGNSYADTTRYENQHGIVSSFTHFAGLDGSYDLVTLHVFVQPAIEYVFLSKKQRGISASYQYYARLTNRPESSKILFGSLEMHLVELNAWIPLAKKQGYPLIWGRAGPIYRYGTVNLDVELAVFLL